MKNTKLLLITLIISLLAGCSYRNQKTDSPSAGNISQSPSLHSQYSLTPTFNPTITPRYNSDEAKNIVTPEPTKIYISPSPAATVPSSTPKPTPKVTAPAPEPTITLTPTPNPENNSVSIYKALYMTEGDDFLLVADSITKHFMIINKKDLSIRKTEYRYASIYEEEIGYYKGPIFSYKNNHFLFISENKLVMSDGKNETLLETIRDPSTENAPRINPLLESDNRILLSFPSEDYMLIYDYRTSIVEKCNAFSVEIPVFTDEFLCFLDMYRIPASGGYYYTYTFRAGKLNLLGVISGYYDFIYSLENNILKITRGEKEYFIDLQTDKLTSTEEMSREQSLYLPTYGTCIVPDLTEIKYINYNHPDQPVQSFQLPDYLIADCMYWYGNTMYTSLYKRNTSGEKILGDPFGEFNLIDSMNFYNEDNSIFPRGAILKEQLYSGNTLLGDGEIYLIENKREAYDGNSICEVTYSEVYAWIPITGTTNAYQLFFSVPRDEDYKACFNLIKALLDISNE